MTIHYVRRAQANGVRKASRTYRGCLQWHATLACGLRVLLPLWVVLGHNALYIAVGFIWLAFVDHGEEESLTIRPNPPQSYLYAGMFCFLLFTHNLVGRMEVPDQRIWFWLRSGRWHLLLVFGVLSVVCQLPVAGVAPRALRCVCSGLRLSVQAITSLEESSGGLKLNSVPVEDCLQPYGFDELRTNKITSSSFRILRG